MSLIAQLEALWQMVHDVNLKAVETKVLGFVKAELAKAENAGKKEEEVLQSAWSRVHAEIDKVLDLAPAAPPAAPAPDKAAS